MGDYRELIFYQKARQVIRETDRLIKSWPKTMQSQEIARQVFRSSTSTGANIAEGHGRYEGAEYIRYLVIAQASANETDHWLNTASDVGLSTPAQIQDLLALNTEVRKMLAASIKTIRNK